VKEPSGFMLVLNRNIKFLKLASKLTRIRL
jgi:hypothetical protein